MIDFEYFLTSSCCLHTKQPIQLFGTTKNALSRDTVLRSCSRQDRPWNVRKFTYTMLCIGRVCELSIGLNRQNNQKIIPKRTHAERVGVIRKHVSTLSSFEFLSHFITLFILFLQMVKSEIYGISERRESFVACDGVTSRRMRSAIEIQTQVNKIPILEVVGKCK